MEVKMSIQRELASMGERARAASRVLSTARTEDKNGALRAMAAAIRADSAAILGENTKDLEDGHAAGLSAATLDRLALDEARIEGMASGLEEIAALRDPIGEVTGMWTVEQGLRIGRVRVPLGVVGIIYEARPNVTADAAGLCLKSGNAVILRGGREALRSNVAIARSLRSAAADAKMPEGTVQLVSDPGHEASLALMQLQALDVLIPRGGKALKKAVTENARVPYIMTGDGNCHTFVDASADQDMALAIILNAKIQRPSVCNALETLLVHRAIADDFLPKALDALTGAGVTVHGDGPSRAADARIVPAGEHEYEAEYLGLDLACAVVDDLDAAVAHIRRYSTGHSETIVTADAAAQRRFTDEVDAAVVLVNASSRFTDGGQFGFGAEIGISTQKLHARGPMGLTEMTTTKYLLLGEGQTRA